MGDILRFLDGRQSVQLINIQKVIISQTHKGDLHKSKFKGDNGVMCLPDFNSFDFC